MATFNLTDYEDKADTPSEEVGSSTDTPTGGPTSAPVADTVETSEITVRGSISEIVAKSLYSIFPNVETVSQENHGTSIQMTVPKMSVEKLSIVTMSRESIISDPVTSLRTANVPGALVYIDMHGRSVHSAQESWFYLNLANEQYYSISALTNKVASLCLR